MARPKKNSFGAISYKRRAGHIDAGVWVDTPSGKRFHTIGRKGDPDLQRKYALFCASYIQEEEDVPLNEVTVAILFRHYLEKRLPHLQPADQHHVKLIMKLLVERFGTLKVREFDCVKFRAAQQVVALHGQRLVRPWSFAYCNKLMGYLRAIFKWGVGRKLFDASNLLEIKTVEPIGAGDEVYDLGDTSPRQDVPDAVIQKTLPYLSAVMVDVVTLIRGACLRPCELVRMRVQDVIESEGGVVEIKHHKTRRFGVRRFAAFSRAEMAILRRRCVGKGADEFVFSPRDTMRELWTRRQFKADEDSLLRFTDQYTTERLGHALAEGIKRARAAGVRIPKWTLYQLRHTAVTENSEKYGVEMASYIAGHRSMKTTAIYDHKAVQCAIQAAEERTRRENKTGPE